MLDITDRLGRRVRADFDPDADLDRLGRMADLATADWRDALEQWDWPKVLDAELPPWPRW